MATESTMEQFGCTESRTEDTLREGVPFETDFRQEINF